jgi:hypothetical protein
MKNINGTGPVNASCIERSGNIDHAAKEKHTKCDDMRVISFISLLPFSFLQYGSFSSPHSPYSLSLLPDFRSAVSPLSS